MHASDKVFQHSNPATMIIRSFPGRGDREALPLGARGQRTGRHVLRRRPGDHPPILV